MHRVCKFEAKAASRRSRDLLRLWQNVENSHSNFPSTSSRTCLHGRRTLSTGVVRLNRKNSDPDFEANDINERRSSNPFRRKLSNSEQNKIRTFESLVTPQPVDVAHPLELAQGDNVGEELTGTSLNRRDALNILSQFASNSQMQKLCREHGLTDRIFHQSYNSFRNHCQNPGLMSPELYIIMSDIVAGAAAPADIYPFFLEHARKVFPHLEFMDELRNISDLTKPHSWYPEARGVNRKIIYHAGPTNSGKTFHALKRFMTASTGVYCGPLKLLANEVFYKCKGMDVKCDLMTGDDRKYATGSSETPSHLTACTIEMVSTQTPIEVGVIDEIQMIRDYQRGWAWTRALLGVPADEIHLCGEAAGVDLVRAILEPVGETVQVENYERITPLWFSDKSLGGSFENVRPGDCIVCFNKNDIFSVTQSLEKLGHQVAVIYGSLPPATKLAQTKRFNDPNDPCKIMVATDAVGMGLNLSINRVVFYSLVKPTLGPKEAGDSTVNSLKKMLITSSAALQIGGRAGRFGTKFDKGEVTTFKPDDLRILDELWKQGPEPITTAGIRPTAEQIEMFSLYLQASSLSNILNMFVSLCSLDDSNYFMCQMEDTMHLAELIDHIPLPMKTKYQFCLAPCSRKEPRVCAMFVKFVRRVSRNEPVTYQWLAGQIGWPLSPPKKIAELFELERMFDVMDVYLWLSFRFPDMFPDPEVVRAMEEELDEIIQEGVANIVKLIDTQQQKKKAAKAKVDPIQALNSLRTQKVSETPKNPLGSKKRRGLGGSVENSLLKTGLVSKEDISQLKKQLSKRDKRRK